MVKNSAKIFFVPLWLTGSLIMAGMLLAAIVAGPEKPSTRKRGYVYTDPTMIAWCADIYHRNISCPLYGKVKVPDEVLVKEEQYEREWCKSIGNRNPGCWEFK